MNLSGNDQIKAVLHLYNRPHINTKICDNWKEKWTFIVPVKFGYIEKSNSSFEQHIVHL